MEKQKASTVVASYSKDNCTYIIKQPNAMCEEKLKKFHEAMGKILYN